MNDHHRIFLVRHGETEFNRAGRYQGQSDSPLTSKGIRQARRNGRALASLINGSADWRLVTSPLGRTLQTARLIGAEIGFDPSRIEVDERIQEIGFGWWEGLDRQTIEAREVGALDARRRDPWTFAMDGGETMAAVARRAEAWLEELDGNVIAVSHGVTGRIIRGLYLSLSRAQTLQLDQPQDIVFELCGRKISRHSPTGGPWPRRLKAGPIRVNPEQVTPARRPARLAGRCNHRCRADRHSRRISPTGRSSGAAPSLHGSHRSHPFCRACNQLRGLPCGVDTTPYGNGPCTSSQRVSPAIPKPNLMARGGAG